MRHLHYGWVMTILAASILAADSLPFYSFGVFLRPVTTEFNWERGDFSMALSLTMIIGGLLAILAGRLSDKYGPRFPVTVSGLLIGAGFLFLSQINSLWQVYLIWGLLMAVGTGCCFIPTQSTIPRWFVEKRGLAVGLAATGFGIGGIITPILAQWLISSYGWRQAYSVLGIITIAIIVPLAQFMKHSPRRAGLQPYGEDRTAEVEKEQPLVSAVEEGLSYKQAIRTGHFWIFGILLMGALFSVDSILAHIVPHAVDIGISETVAASIVSIIAAVSIIGRNIVGYISDKIGARWAFSVYLFSLTAALAWLFFSQEVWMFYLFAVIFGLAFGSGIPLKTLITWELFGLKNLGMLMAMLSVFGAIGSALGPPLVGYIFDATTSYSLAFIICIIISVLALALSLILLRSKRGIAESGQDIHTT